ncbi:MAG: hypothetical protein B9S32_02355 [Verrucomicrobia bacterium Tous-C9LFEB]|nr:MAG: hypothetical protein B9S32_02355 [Verrucomicrobia bacterium Tous-C9LFEB]
MTSEFTSRVNEPLFSICIPAYKGENFIRIAIDSIVRQTCKDWELVIVDDASPDRTWEVLQEYKNHNQIHLFRNEKNLGQGANFNRCLAHAQGKWAIVLAGDDSLVPHALETILSTTNDRSDIILWISAHLCLGNKTNPTIPPIFSQVKEFESNEFTETLYLHGGMFGEVSNFAFRRDRYVETCTHGFPETTSHMDADFWMRLMRSNPTARVIFWPEPLVHILIHEESRSSLDERSGKHIVEIFNSTEISLSIGWSRPVLLRQLVRMLWVNLKFFPVLPRGEKFRSLQTVRLIGREILRS